MKRGLKHCLRQGYRYLEHRPRRGPDEEGIETVGIFNPARQDNFVREEAPMKRGLKHSWSTGYWVHLLKVREEAPMKRGLKPTNL